MTQPDNPFDIKDISRITDAHVRYFRDHPDQISLLNDRETFRRGRLFGIFAVAVAFVAASKLFVEHYADEYEQLFNNVLVDLLFEMGAALIGSVATLIFFEYSRKRKFEDNLRVRLEIERRIAGLPSETGATDTQ